MSRTLLAARAGWTPASLTTLRGWYRADMGLTLVGSDVDAWADQSGNGNHLPAGGAGNRPLYVATGFNGGAQPYVQGDGVAEYFLRTVFSMGAAVGAFTVAYVCKALSGTNGRALWQYGTSVPPYVITTGGTALPNILGINNVPSTGTSVLTTARLSTYWWDGATQKIYAGATQEDSDANANAGPADGGRFSVIAGTTGSVPINMQVAEAIVMRAALTPAELAALAAYATARYGV